MQGTTYIIEAGGTHHRTVAPLDAHDDTLHRATTLARRYRREQEAQGFAPTVVVREHGAHGDIVAEFGGPLPTHTVEQAAQDLNMPLALGARPREAAVVWQGASYGERHRAAKALTDTINRVAGFTSEGGATVLSTRRPLTVASLMSRLDREARSL